MADNEKTKRPEQQSRYKLVHELIRKKRASMKPPSKPKNVIPPEPASA